MFQHLGRVKKTHKKTGFLSSAAVLSIHIILFIDLFTRILWMTDHPGEQGGVGEHV